MGVKGRNFTFHLANPQNGSSKDATFRKTEKQKVSCVKMTTQGDLATEILCSGLCPGDIFQVSW